MENINALALEQFLDQTLRLHAEARSMGYKLEIPVTLVANAKKLVEIAEGGVLSSHEVSEKPTSTDMESDSTKPNQPRGALAEGILKVLESGRTMSVAEVIDELHAAGITGYRRQSVQNTLARHMENGLLERPEKGMYVKAGRKSEVEEFPETSGDRSPYKAGDISRDNEDLDGTLPMS